LVYYKKLELILKIIFSFRQNFNNQKEFFKGRIFTCKANYHKKHKP
jgi:hypothetical protein